MKKRAKAGGSAIKRDSTPKTTAANSNAKSTEVVRLSRELNESREQQTATAGVLRMISRFPSDVQSVLEAIVRIAGELCEAEYAILFRLYEGKYRVACSNNAAAEFVRYFAENPISVNKGSLIGRTVLARHAVHIEDCLADPEYKLDVAARLGRHRTMLGVPLLHEGEVLGAIGLLRTVVKPFTEKQIELVTAFADEAVIAIENARLLNELRQSLEQQTATAEVLNVISTSPGELSPVFTALLEKAVRICGAKFGNLWLREGNVFRIGATHGAPAAYVEFLEREQVFLPDPRLGLGQIIQTKETFRIADIAAEPSHADRMRRATIELASARTLIGVPMLKDGEVIGAIGIYRQEVRPFTGKQIELVKNFAAQAVIAIENARLLNELRQRTTDLTERTADLTEALEQQTATSEVLKVISSRPGDLEPVFATMLENAVRICDAEFGNIQRWDGEQLHLLAMFNTPPAYTEARGLLPHYRPNPKALVGRMLATKTAMHVTDLAADEAYVKDRVPATVAAVEHGGVRTALAVPMLREEGLIGAFVLCRLEVRAFTGARPIRPTIYWATFARYLIGQLRAVSMGLTDHPAIECDRLR